MDTRDLPALAAPTVRDAAEAELGAGATGCISRRLHKIAQPLRMPLA